MPTIRELLKVLLKTDNRDSIVGAVNEVLDKTDTASNDAQDANMTVRSHSKDSVKHITKEERQKWNAKAERADILDQKTELYKYISANTSSIATLKIDVNKNKSDISALTTKQKDLLTKADTTEKGLSALASTVTANVNDLKTNISNLDKAVNSKEQKITQAGNPPASPVNDQLWIDTTTTPNTMKRYDGAAWATVGSVVDESKFVKASGSTITGPLDLNSTTGALVLPVGKDRYATI